MWLDDKHDDIGFGKGFKGQAKDKGIDLCGFGNVEEAEEELKNNYKNYDAIILDAKFNLTRNQALGTEDTDAMHEAIKMISNFSEKKFEFLVFSGQPKSYRNDEIRKMVKSYGSKIYIKVDDDEKLLDHIKVIAARQADTQLKHTHSRIFELCDDNYLSQSSERLILSILKRESISKNNTNDFGTILEQLFKSLRDKELLPKELINEQNGEEQLSLAECSKFLSGIHERYKLNESHPKYMTDSIRAIGDLRNPGSHDSKLARADHEEARYYFDGATLLLFGVLLWFKKYVDSNPTKNNWEIIENEVIHEGFIDKDSDGNFFCGEYKLDYRPLEKLLNEEKITLLQTKVLIHERRNNIDQRSSNLYPYFCFEKMITIQ